MDKTGKPWNKKSETITFVEILYEYLRHWKLFILAISICLVIALVVIFTTQKVYRTSLSILLNEDKTTRPKSSEIDLEALGLLSTTNNIDNEVAILNSPDLMLKVVENLNLQTTYYTRNKLRLDEIYSKSPFFVTCNIQDDNFNGIVDISIEKNELEFNIKGFYEVFGTKINIDEKVSSFPVKISLENSGAELNIQVTGKDIKESEKYYIIVKNTLETANDLCNSLSIVPTSKSSSVLKIGIIVNNQERGAAILKELVTQYNEQNITINNEIAYNTSIFINERLREISGELEVVEDDVVDYKQKNQITDISSEAELFVKQTGQNEERLLEIDTQLNIILMVENYVNNPENYFKLIPNLGISDTGLSLIIKEYNNKLINSENLLKNMGEENPTRIRLIEQIDNERKSIVGSLKNVKQSYNVAKQDYKRQSNSTLSRVQSVPLHEKGLISIVREQKIKENLVTFLMQKKEETNLSIASTSNKARIIVSPQIQQFPIAPKSKIILLSALLIGFLIPIIGIYIINLFKTKISNRSELEKLSSVSIIGEIVKNVESNQIVVNSQLNTGIGEMFRSLRNNLNFIFSYKNHQIILITSTTSGEGKTFISINLALTFALSGAKVLLVETDIRNPRFKNYINPKTKDGLTNFLVTEDDNWENYIKKTELDSNLDIIHAGTIPPNPNELMMKPLMKQFLFEAKEKYDIVILDTAPVGLVSDTFLISGFADACLYVVRENVTPKDAVNFINMQKEENKLKNMYLVLNGSSLNASYKYGYGKAYGYENK